jgi:hypothetical protein
MKNLGQYSKLIVALAAAAGVLGVAAADGSISTSEWIQVALAFIGALGVYSVPNKPRDA